MRLFVLLAAGLFAGSLVAADDKKEKKVKDEETILGTWVAEEFDTGTPGVPTAIPAAQRHRWTFDKGSRLVQRTADPAAKPEAGEYKLDPAAKVKAFDLTNNGRTTLAVYELDGDTLKVCFSTGKNAARPAELKPDGKSTGVITFKRAKDEEKEDKKDK